MMKKKTAFGHYLDGIGLTASSLAEASGVEAAVIRSLIGGAPKGLTFEDIHSLCKALGFTLDELAQLANTPATLVAPRWVSLFIERRA